MHIHQTFVLNLALDNTENSVPTIAFLFKSLSLSAGKGKEYVFPKIPMPWIAASINNIALSWRYVPEWHICVTY